jgi:hypothetical protein
VPKDTSTFQAAHVPKEEGKERGFYPPRQTLTPESQRSSKEQEVRLPSLAWLTGFPRVLGVG